MSEIMRPSPLKEKIASRGNFPESKREVARMVLKRYIDKFFWIDSSLLRELERVSSTLEPLFVDQRSVAHLVKLSLSIFFIRKQLARKNFAFASKNPVDVRIFPSSLAFPFGSKFVLSILTHIRLEDRYQLLDEKHILSIVRKSIADAKIIEDACYLFYSSKNCVKTIYVEIERSQNAPFAVEEIKSLKRLLGEKITSSIEEVVPAVFAVFDDEELLKRSQILVEELSKFSHLPQVMILPGGQTLYALFFTVICAVVEKNDLSEEIAKVLDAKGIEFSIERYYPLSFANRLFASYVLRLKLEKDFSFSWTDESVNFYQARQKICDLLTRIFGRFRDYNGGILSGERELLTALKKNYPHLSSEERNLIEGFYYSLRPISAQITHSLEELKTFFELFWKVHRSSRFSPTSSSLKVRQKSARWYGVMHLSDKKLKREIDPLVSPFQKVVTFSFFFKRTYFVGYLLAGLSPKMHRRLLRSIDEVLVSWEKRQNNPQILKLYFKIPVISFDPRVGGDEASALLIKTLFEGLMRMNRQGVLEKGLAKRIEISEDKKTYRFTLRVSYWSNGSILTAEDFAYSWKKILSPSFDTPFAYLLYPIKNAYLAKRGEISSDAIGIRVLDPYTLEVELHSPAPYFLELLAHTVYFPVSRMVDQVDPSWPLKVQERYICNGAFRLQEVRKWGECQLVRNLFYWDKGNIALDGIEVCSVSTSPTFMILKQKIVNRGGVLMGVWDIKSPHHIGEMDLVYLNTSVYAPFFNTHRSPFLCEKIRHAFSRTIDLVEIEKRFHVYPPRSLVFPERKGNMRPHLSTEEARILFWEGLEELNLSTKNLQPIVLTYLKGFAHEPILYFLQARWQEIFGVQVTLYPLEWKELFNRMTCGAFDIGGMLWTSWVNDPFYTLSVFKTADNPINFSRWENPGYRKLTERIENTIDETKRSKLCIKAEKVLLEAAPMMPLFSIKRFALKRSEISLDCSSLILDFKWGCFE